MRRSQRIAFAIAHVSVVAVSLLTSSCKRQEAASHTKPEPVAVQKTGDASAGKATWETTCLACHSIGAGDRTGPDLKDVSKRRERAWLDKWMKDPMTMAQTDPLGKEIFAKFKNVPMPNLNLTDAQISNVLAFIDAESAKEPAAAEAFVPLAAAEFEQAKNLFFNRCAGCHGTLRKGATGPDITPERTNKIGSAAIRTILTNGTPGGMPGWGREGILTAGEIAMMATYVQMDPPEPPQRPIEDIRKSWNLVVPPAKRPTKPMTSRNWRNYFGVVLRDAGKVAILDGDTKELVSIIPTGFAVHILRASSSGRYFLAIGRDGKVTMIDLWPEQPTLVAQVQGCFDARSVDGSKVKGWEDKLVIEGCYWPPQYVIYDGQTLEPKKVHSVLSETYDSKEPLKEVRVAAIFALHDEPMWALNLKESGYVGFVDYSKPDFPMSVKVAAERFLHDGGYDHTKRYLLSAANMRNQMAIIDLKEKKLVAKVETGNKPHPGRGANWQDPEFGWVNGTVHIGEAKLAVYGADPVKHPQHAWKVVRTVNLPAAGGLFLKTHEKSPWVWTDSPLSADEKGPHQICVYEKKAGKLSKCWSPTEKGRMVHFEYNRAGDEVWVSMWDKQGELIIYDDATLAQKSRIKADWLVTPTGKFNVWNTANDVY